MHSNRNICKTIALYHISIDIKLGRAVGIQCITSEEGSFVLRASHVLEDLPTRLETTQKVPSNHAATKKQIINNDYIPPD